MPMLTTTPIPQKLHEMLKEHPKHIKRLQEYLNDYLSKPSKITPLFEQVIWALEGCLETFIHEAEDELEAARANRDEEAISMAEDKVSLMRRARSSNGGMMNLEDLWQHFEAHKDVIK